MTLKPKGGFKYVENELSARLATWCLSVSSWQALQKPGINFAKNQRGGEFYLKEQE